MPYRMTGVFLIFLIFQGCVAESRPKPYITVPVTMRTLPTADFELDYFKFSRIYFLAYPDIELKVLMTSGSRNQVYILEGTEIQEVTLIAPTDCKYPSYLSFQAAGNDGILSLLQCTGYFEGVAPGYKANAVFLVEIDLDSGEVMKIYEHWLEHPTHFETFNYDIEKERGVITSYSMWTILELLPDGIKPIDLELNSTSGSWNLKDPLYVDPFSPEADLLGHAGYAAMQTSTGKIAFLTTFDPISKRGIRRFVGSRYQVIVVDEELRLIHQTTAYISNPLQLEWSPIDDTVLIAGSVFGVSGLWSYDTANSQFTLIDQGEFKSVTWSTAGDIAYGLKCKTWDSYGLCERVEIVEYKFD